MIPERCRMIYFVEAENGLIKIGSSKWPEQRARSICGASPVKARLIITFQGGMRAEFAAHRQYRESRAWNEWFHCTGALAEFVAENRGLGVEHILDWAEIAFYDRKVSPASLEARARQSKIMRAKWADPKVRASLLQMAARTRARNKSATAPIEAVSA